MLFSMTTEYDHRFLACGLWPRPEIKPRDDRPGRPPLTPRGPYPLSVTSRNPGVRRLPHPHQSPPAGGPPGAAELPAAVRPRQKESEVSPVVDSSQSPLSGLGRPRRRDLRAGLGERRRRAGGAHRGAEPPRPPAGPAAVIGKSPRRKAGALLWGQKRMFGSGGEEGGGPGLCNKKNSLTCSVRLWCAGRGPSPPRSSRQSAGLSGPAGTQDGRHVRVAVPASAGAPWGGSPPLRPRPLLRLPVSAAGGGRLCSFSSPFRHRFRVFRIFAIKKRLHVSVKPWCAGRGPSTRALPDSPLDCRARPGRRTAGRAVRVPSGKKLRAFRIFAIKKRLHVSVKPWCAGRDSNPRPSDS